MRLEESRPKQRQGVLGLGVGAGLDAEDGRGEHELVVDPGLCVDRAHEGGGIVGERSLDLCGLVLEYRLAGGENVPPSRAACRRLPEFLELCKEGVRKLAPRRLIEVPTDLGKEGLV